MSGASAILRFHMRISRCSLGKKTGAWEATLSSDPAILDPASCVGSMLCISTTQSAISSARLTVRDAFASYVAAGGGLIGNHATTVTATDWKEFGNISGGRGASHRMTDEKVTINVEDSATRSLRSSAKVPFEYADEIFRFQPPYSRENVHVLVKRRSAKDEHESGPLIGQCYRDDNDYPVAWIKPYGKGRVFYTTLGQTHTCFRTLRCCRCFSRVSSMRSAT